MSPPPDEARRATTTFALALALGLSLMLSAIVVLAGLTIWAVW
jgi:hypothetical protein